MCFPSWFIPLPPESLNLAWQCRDSVQTGGLSEREIDGSETNTVTEKAFGANMQQGFHQKAAEGQKTGYSLRYGNY